MPFPRQNIELVGNLGRDAEMRYSQTGTQITNFSLAVTRQWQQGGEDKKETTWVNVTAWEKLAEACATLSKGQQVLVKGYFKPDTVTGRPRTWTGQDGTVGASYELTANEVWLGVFPSRGSGGGGQRQEQGGDFGQFGPPEDDIPF